MHLKSVLPAIALLIGLTTIPQISYATEYLIGLSPYTPAAQANTQAKHISQFLIKTLKVGDNATIYDAWHLRTVATFHGPKNRAYAHPRTILKTNGTAIAKLRRFVSTSRVPHGSNEPLVRGAVNLPQFLRMLGQYRTSTGPIEVLIFANPLYDHPKSRAFSMANGRVPGFGHLFHSSTATIYGVDNLKLLSEMRVHFAYPDARWSQHPHHAIYVERFWRHFISRQGGSFVTFTGDPTLLFSRVRSKAPAPQHNDKIVPSKKLEMLFIQKPKLTSAIFQQSATIHAPQPEKIQKARNTLFSTRWDCAQCDMDIYVKPTKTSQALYFGHTKTSEGRYQKDFVNAPPASGYETVTLSNKPINLTRTLVAINFYDGHAPKGVQGELRILLDGEVYSYHFKIAATQGNKGRGNTQVLATGRSTGPHWLVIDIPKALKLK